MFKFKLCAIQVGSFDFFFGGGGVMGDFEEKIPSCKQT